MVKKNKEKTRKVARYLAVIFIILIGLNIAAIFLNNQMNFKQKDIEKNFTITKKSGEVLMELPAINSEGEGVITTLKVESIPDSDGRTLTDIENILFFADTQQSIRKARMVAEDITGIDCSEIDLIYNIEANASIIGGPSAGAAITISTIFALQGKSPRDKVMITGDINHDGSIGPVSAILEKAKAAKQAGGIIFLVPLGQLRGVVYETREHCEKFGFTEVCQTETIPIKVNISEQAGITVKEVESVEEALQYFEK